MAAPRRGPIAFGLTLGLVAAGLVTLAPPASSTGWPLVTGGYTLEDLAYDGFSYSSGSLDNRNGGTGWANAWTTDPTPFATGVEGLTYTGLPTDDSAIRATGTGGNNSDTSRILDDSVDSGVVYFQFLSIFQNNHGGGTPNIRLFYSGNQTGAIGNNGFSPGNMALMDSSLSPVAVSTAPLTQLNLTVLRIDYEQSETKLWINPDLTTFDYANPPADDTHALGFAPKIDRIYPISRYGGDPNKDKLDEIRIMRLVAPTPTPTPTPPTPAGQPRDVAAIAGDSRASLTWDTPTSQGSFPISFYQAESIPRGGSCLTRELTCEVSRLTNGVTYTFRVRALTGAGWGAWSTPSPAVTPTAPPRPTIVISGSRGEIEGRSAVIVVGRVTDVPEGTLLHPWLRMERNTSFAEGSARIGMSSSGTFRWQRRTSRPISVYMASPDGSLRSNTVTIR